MTTIDFDRLQDSESLMSDFPALVSEVVSVNPVIAPWFTDNMRFDYAAYFPSYATRCGEFNRSHLLACLHDATAEEVTATQVHSLELLRLVTRFSDSTLREMFRGYCIPYLAAMHANSYDNDGLRADLIRSRQIYAADPFRSLYHIPWGEEATFAFHPGRWDDHYVWEYYEAIRNLPREGCYSDLPPFPSIPSPREETVNVGRKCFTEFMKRENLHNFLNHALTNPACQSDDLIRRLMGYYLLAEWLEYADIDITDPFNVVVTCEWTGFHAFRSVCSRLGTTWGGVVYALDRERVQMCPDCQNVVIRQSEDTCESCSCRDIDYDEEEEREEELHGYSFKAERTHRAFSAVNGEKVNDRTMYLGVELETNCPNVDDVREATEEKGIAFLCEDGSLCRGGYEIKTIPATLRWHYKHWRALFNAMGGEGEHRSCGMHVHVSRKGLGHLTIAKLVHLVSTVSRARAEKLFGRAFNDYCRRPEEGITYSQTWNDDRYRATNTGNTKTVEFRMFASTTDRKVFIARLEMCAAMIRYCRETPIGSIHIAASEDKVNRTDFITWVKNHAHEYRLLDELVHGKRTVVIKGETVIQEVREIEPGTRAIEKRKAKKLPLAA